jgi:antitoxin ParD1/3/4
MPQRGTFLSLVRYGPMTTRRAGLNVSLTPELVRFVAAQVASGRYGSASEVVRASLRMLLEKDGEPRVPAVSAEQNRTISRG